MLIKFTGGTVYDPMNGVDGEVRDIYAQDGRIVAAPPPGTKIDAEYSLGGRVVMAGAIDPHSHIGGGKVTIGRMLLPEDHQGHEVARTELMRSGCGHAVPSTMTTGYRYAEMGYTAAFEPAMLPANARQAHLVTLRLFGGLTVKEIADDLSVSESTIEKEWRRARAWLSARLELSPTP